MNVITVSEEQNNETRCRQRPKAMTAVAPVLALGLMAGELLPSEYGIGSPLLNYCFRRNGAKLSRVCVNALIQAGDVSKAYVQARRRAGH